jgi:hypothetical protein
MPIIAIFQGPSLTRESYEDAVRRMTDGKGLQKAADWPVQGLIMHAAGDGPKGFRVVDVWSSTAAFQEFGAILAPVLQAAGVQVEPEVYEAHTLVKA